MSAPNKMHVAACLALAVALMLAAPVYAAGQSYLMVVSGIGGDAHYSEEFATRSKTMIDAAEKRLGLPRERIVYLAESRDGGADGQSRKNVIAAAIDDVAVRARSGDAVFLLLIGHGTARGDRLLFNLPGPDLSAAELAAMIEPYGNLRWVIINGAPSSGPFVKALSAPQRIVITATANAAERYHTVFPEHFIAAYAKAGADSDKNGRVSVLEAFTFAQRGVQHSYEEQAALQSEHALLDDVDDLARLTYLESDHTRYSKSIPAEELARLLAERDRLEQRIASLIAVKSDYDPLTYDDRLESLLVEFALVHRALRPEKATP